MQNRLFARNKRTSLPSVPSRLLALALMDAALLACVPPEDSGNSAQSVRCSIRVDNPHHSSGSPGRITAKVTVRCSGNIESVTVIAKIQRKSRGRWIDMGNGTIRDVGLPKRGKGYTVTEAIACAAGTFRTGGRGYGYRGGVRSQSVRWEYSKAVTNPCG